MAKEGAFTMKSLVVILMFLALSCDMGEPPPPIPPPPPPPQYVRTIDLVVEDVGVIDAAIHIRFLDTARARTFQILRNGQTFVTHSLLAADTLIVDTVLAPNHTYLYQAYRLDGTARIDSSLDTTVTTMGTTSHDFTFQTFYFGGSSSSKLRDVVIIDENNIWAVGEVYVTDSSGHVDPIPYNIIRWDGVQWGLQRAYFSVFCNQPDTVPYPANSVIAFSENSVVVMSNGQQYAKWNGTTFDRFCIPFVLAGSINEAFGLGDNKIYGVGYSGTIVYFDGNVWTSIPSGTTSDIQDVWATDGGPVLVAVSNILSLGDRKILSIGSNGSVDSTNWFSTRRVNSIWFEKNARMFASGDGVHMKAADMVWRRQEEIPLYYTRRIRGNHSNDVFVVSDFGMTAHFNGVSWRVFPGNFDDLFYSCDMKENLMVAVGSRGSQALVVVARR